MARWKLALFWLGAGLFIGAVLFGSAGRWDVPMFWAYLGLWSVFGLINALTIDLDLARERFRPGGESRDNLKLLRGLGLVVFLGHWVVAGLDAGRYHWSAMPLGVRVAGLVGLATALLLIGWAQRVNRFFSPAMRIQRDRGHHVVSSGPYRFVRHPGYAAFSLAGVCSGLSLGSWWSAALMLSFALLFVRRAAMEDRLLHEELEGYPEYAAKVRYRLIPGVW